MHPEHGGSLRGGQGGRGESALLACGQTHTQSFPDEIFIAQRHQDRPSSFYKVFYMAQQTKTVISVFAESCVGSINTASRATPAATARSAAAVTSAITSSTTPRSEIP